MPYREKRIYSGAMLEIERTHCTHSGRVIGKKSRGFATGKAQEKINLRNAQLKLIRTMCENFTRGDYHITLTHEKLLSREDQKKNLEKFLRKLRAEVKKQTGREMRYVCVREDRGVRPHYHLVCEKFPLRVELLAELWTWGRVDVGTLDGNPDYGWLARYLTKQEDQDKGKKRWSQSKNLRKPYEAPAKVLKRKSLAQKPKAPKGYYVLSYYHNATGAGYEWQYMICIRLDRKQELPLDIQMQLEEEGVWSAYESSVAQFGL